MKGKYVLGYSAENASEPILWKLVKEYDVRVNILRAEISPGQEGNMLVEFDVDEERNMKSAIAWIESIGVSCVSVAKRLTWKEEKCVDCGACAGVCLFGRHRSGPRHLEARGRPRQVHCVRPVRESLSFSPASSSISESERLYGDRFLSR